MHKVWYVTKVFLALVWAAVWVVAAIACGISLILIPLGFVFWIIGCYPINRMWQKRIIKQVRESNEKDYPIDFEEEPPWRT